MAVKVNLTWSASKCQANSGVALCTSDLLHNCRLCSQFKYYTRIFSLQIKSISPTTLKERIMRKIYKNKQTSIRLHICSSNEFVQALTQYWSLVSFFFGFKDAFMQVSRCGSGFVSHGSPFMSLLFADALVKKKKNTCLS